MKLRRLLLKATVLSFCFVMLAACHDDDVSGGSPNPEEPGIKPDFETKITASVNGFITNENDEPFAGVKVTAGDISVQTDASGYFEIRNTSLTKDISFLTAESEGYFRGIRTWRGNSGQKDFVRVKLLPKTIIGTITAQSGGAVATADGAKLKFPANGVVTADGASYTGTVNVAARWMNPATDDIYMEMPGDLRAINTSENMVGLTTYGMLAVELTSTSGDLLNVAPDKKVEMSMPIPSEFQATAPQDMPLWYFDETKGLWIEEGISKRSGSEYVGEVGHFSFWNCDIQAELTDFSGQLNDSEDNPIAGAKINLVAKCIDNSSRTVYTSSSGRINGYVPANCEIIMYVYGADKSCPVTVHEFTTGSGKTDIGKLNTLAEKEQKISGKISSCNDKPVTDGYIIYEYDGLERNFVEVVDGKYKFTIITCKAGDTELKLTGYNNLDKNKAEATASVPRSASTFEVPDMYTCDTYSYITMVSSGQSTTITQSPFNSGESSYVSGDIYSEGSGGDRMVAIGASKGLGGKRNNISITWLLPKDKTSGIFDLDAHSWYSGNGIYQGTFKSGTVNINSLETTERGDKATIIGTYKGIVSGYTDVNEDGYTTGDEIERPVSGSFYYSGYVIPQ